MAQQFPNEFFKKDTPHGLVKRIMYKKYLQAFIPITLRTGYSAVIFDGFAGVGRYGEEWPREIEEYGSPLIALMVVLNFFYKEMTKKERRWGKPKEENEEIELADLINKMTLQEREPAEPTEPKVTLYFIEKNSKNFEALKDNVAEVLNDFFPNPDVWYTESKQTNSYFFTLFHPAYPVRVELFNTAFSSFNPAIACQGIGRAKFLTFLDPFGFTQTPLVNVRQFVGKNKSLLINFMSSFVNRFAATCGEGQLSGLFGRVNECANNYDDDHETDTSHMTYYEALLKFMEQTFNAKRGVTVRQYASNAEKYAALYKSILEKIFKSRYSLSFEMRGKRNNIIYHLIFACWDFSSLKGMKEAMNRCTQADEKLAMSDYKFEKNNNCLDLGNSQEEGSVADAIFKEFRGKSVRISKIESFVWLETPFVFRKGPLHLMLTEPNPRLLQVTNGCKMQPISPDLRGTFPDGIDWLLTFKYGTPYPELDIWDIGMKIYSYFNGCTVSLSIIKEYAKTQGELRFRTRVLVGLMKENPPIIIDVRDKDNLPPPRKYSFPDGKEWLVTFRSTPHS